MNNQNNQNYNSPPPYYDEETNLIDQYASSSSSPLNLNSNVSLPPSLPIRRTSLTPHLTGTSNIRSNSHNPFLIPSVSAAPPSIIRPSASVLQTPTINHSHSAPYLNSNFTGNGSNSSSQYSDGNPFNNHSSPHLTLSNNVRDQRVVSDNFTRSTASGNMRAVSSNQLNMNDRIDQRRDYLPSLPNETGIYEYDVGMGGMSLVSMAEGPRISSAPTTPFKPSIYTSSSGPNLNQPTSPRQIQSTNPNSPLPALPTNGSSVLSSFATSLNSVIDNSFFQIDKFVQLESSRRNQSSNSSTNLSTSPTKPPSSSTLASDASDPLTSAFLSSFPSLDEQSPVLPPKALSPHSTGSIDVESFSIEASRDELKKQIGHIVRDEIRRRDEVVRIDLEREIKELKVNFLFLIILSDLVFLDFQSLLTDVSLQEANLLSTKIVQTLTKDRDTLKETNEKLSTELTTSQLNFSLDLSTASTSALLLQERIDVLQIALNEETIDGNNHSRGGSSREVEEEGDSIWSVIVDEQSKVRSLSLSSFV